MNPYSNIELVCLCGAPFIWTAGEQKFMNDLCDAGKINAVQQPKRCAPCRKMKRDQRERLDNRE